LRRAIRCGWRGASSWTTTSVISKMQRSRYPHHIVFLHGVTQRAFRMHWFDRSPDWFEEEPNPANASVTLIERDGRGRWVDRVLVSGAAHA
jgi:broad specificity phosphatase PhoE